MTPMLRAALMVLLSTGGANLALWAGESLYTGRWISAVTSGVIGLSCLLAAVWLLRIGPPLAPEWTRRYEIVAGLDGSVLLYCNHCDAVVLPSGPRVPLTQLLVIGFRHATTACVRHRAQQPGGETDRLAEAFRRAQSRRGPDRHSWISRQYRREQGK